MPSDAKREKKILIEGGKGGEKALLSTPKKNEQEGNSRLMSR